MLPSVSRAADHQSIGWRAANSVDLIGYENGPVTGTHLTMLETDEWNDSTMWWLHWLLSDGKELWDKLIFKLQDCAMISK